jgi:pimeloyl-ACP methyl ester carboxylesterase
MQSSLRNAVSRLASGIDRVFTKTALGAPRRDALGRAFDHAAQRRTLSAIASFYGRPEFLTRENALFPRPAAIAPEVVPVKNYGKQGMLLDLHWPSAFEPLWSTAALREHLQTLTAAELADFNISLDRDIAQQLGLDQSGELREKYLRAQANRTAHARWFRHIGAPRPCVVLIHGYMAGNYALEARLWPVRRIFELGCDVVISVLPLHGVRRSELRGYRPPAFPSSDPRFTIEGFRQLVHDHRALFDYLSAGRVSRLGVMGMSLGGYSAALLATLESSLQLGLLFVPLAAVEDFAHTAGRMPGDVTEQAALRDGLRNAYASISPFARPPQIAGERMVVVAGEADQVTGLVHAQRLAEHFAAELSVFHGGHLLQLGRDEAYAPVWQRLARFVEEGPL